MRMTGYRRANAVRCLLWLLVVAAGACSIALKTTEGYAFGMALLAAIAVGYRLWVFLKGSCECDLHPPVHEVVEAVEKAGYTYDPGTEQWFFGDEAGGYTVDEEKVLLDTHASPQWLKFYALYAELRADHGR